MADLPHIKSMLCDLLSNCGESIGTNGEYLSNEVVAILNELEEKNYKCELCGRQAGMVYGIKRFIRASSL